MENNINIYNVIIWIEIVVYAKKKQFNLAGEEEAPTAAAIPFNFSENA